MARQLSRLITLQQRTLTPDDSGGQVETWVDVENLWADFMPSTGGESWRGRVDQAQAIRSGTFIIRHRDIDPTMRIVYDGLNWNVQDIQEIGIRYKLKLSARTL